jgi:hypothetical protein
MSWLHLARPPFLPILEGPHTPVISADLRPVNRHQTRNCNRLPSSPQGSDHALPCHVWHKVQLQQGLLANGGIPNSIDEWSSSVPATALKMNTYETVRSLVGQREDLLYSAFSLGTDRLGPGPLELCSCCFTLMNS